MKLQLYPWQKSCLQSWFSHQCHGILNVVTGAGKTVLAISAAEQLKNTLNEPLRVKIIVPQTVLIQQWSHALQKLLGISRQKIGYYYGLHKDEPVRPFMIYVINSARYSLSRHILQDIREGFSVLLIADECHHYASAENRKIFEFLPLLGDRKASYYSLGLSATPYTDGWEQYLVPALGPEIYRYSFSDALEKRTISSYTIYNIALSFSPEEEGEYQDLTDRLSLLAGVLAKRCPSLLRLNETQYFHALKHLAASSESDKICLMARAVLALYYQRKEVICCAEARIGCVLELISRLSLQDRLLIFGERIEQADILYRELNLRYPNQVGRYHSEMEKETRKTVLDRYRNGELRILVTCRALDEGLDIPSANIGIILSSSATKRQRIQRLGRILRCSKQKKNAALYYLYIRGCSEQTTYMAEAEHPRSFSLSYCTAKRQFQFQEYEALAFSIEWHFRNLGKDEAAQAEVRRCLSLGLLRSDWLLPEADYDRLEAEAATTHQQNYWLCMKLLHAEYEKTVQ